MTLVFKGYCVAYQDVNVIRNTMKGRAKYIRGVFKGSTSTAVVMVVALGIYDLIFPYDIGGGIISHLLIPTAIIAGISGLTSASLFVLIASSIVRKRPLDYSNIWAVATGVILAFIQPIMLLKIFLIELMTLWSFQFNTNANANLISMFQFNISASIMLLLAASCIGIIVCVFVFAVQYILKYLWSDVLGY